MWRCAPTPRQNARQRRSAATKETTHDREAHARHNTTNRGGSQPMRDAATRFGRSHRRRHRSHFAFIEHHGTSMAFGFTASIALIRGRHERIVDAKCPMILISGRGMRRVLSQTPVTWTPPASPARRRTYWGHERTNEHHPSHVRVHSCPNVQLTPTSAIP